MEDNYLPIASKQAHKNTSVKKQVRGNDDQIQCLVNTFVKGVKKVSMVTEEVAF